MKILFEQDARAALMSGAKNFSRAVGKTLGPGGRLVAIAARGHYALTKDGVTVSREIDPENPFHAAASRIIRGAAESVVESAGDGTTTVAVLVGAMLNEAAKYIAAGISPVMVARGIRDGAAGVVEILKGMTTKVETREDLFRVAHVASNGDDEIANMVADALLQAGPDGVITIEDGVLPYSTLKVVSGAQYPAGWISPEFVTDLETMVCKFERPYIFLCEAHLHPMPPIGGLLEKVYSSGRPILIFCESISGPALKTLHENNRRKTLRSCAVVNPYFSDIKTEVMRDLAALTGATIFNPLLGRGMERLTLQDLGQARSVVVSKFNTSIIGAGGSPEAMAARIAYIKAKCDAELSNYEKKRWRERLSKLSGGVAIIEAGGVTESAMKERRDRIDDALNATRHAMTSGALPGGGAALIHAAKLLALTYGLDDWQKNLMKNVCSAPLLRIAENAGARALAVLDKVLEAPQGFGYDARSGVICDLVAAGIVDPAKVTISVMDKAAETAALLVNTGCVVLKGGECG